MANEASWSRRERLRPPRWLVVLGVSLIVLVALVATDVLLIGGPGTGGLPRQPGWTGAYGGYFTEIISNTGETYEGVLVDSQMRYMVPSGTYSYPGCGVPTFGSANSFSVWPGFHTALATYGGTDEDCTQGLSE